MSTQINGGSQIKSGTVTGTQLAATTVADTNLVTSYIKADGTRAFTGAVSLGSNQINSVADPTSAQDAATKNYVDIKANGLTPKAAVDVATTGVETFTISSGAVTTINGTTIDGQSPAIGWRILVKDSPASTGVGSANSTQPGNGIYTVTGNTTNLTVSRVTDMSGSNGAAGAWVFVEAGTANGNGNYGVISPVTGTATTYGTTNIQWSQTNGLGDVTVGGGGSLVKTNNQLTRAALTGDVTASADSNATTIAAAAVTLAKQASLAANSVIGNLTGSGATPVAVPTTAAATASTVMARDTNANVRANSLIENLATTATAAGTTTLTVGSARLQQFTGTTTQTVVLPDATTLVAGQAFTITNRSTGVVTVNANGGGLVQTMAAASQTSVTVTAVGSSAGSWDSQYSITNAGAGGGTVTTASVATANGFAGTVASATTTPVITLTTSVTGVLKGNGTAISAATAGTDFLSPGGYVVRETPSGTVNGSTTAFTLANTPTSGTEMVFKNGLLQAAGGTDYSISTNTITFASAPLTGDSLLATYWH